MNRVWGSVLTNECYNTDMGIDDIFKKLSNKKVCICWDEARGLFVSEHVDWEHSIIFRAVRRAFCRIARELRSESDCIFVGVVMDTNSNISNFLSPHFIDPSKSRVVRLGLSLAPAMPALPFVMTFDLFANDLIIKNLKKPTGILKGRNNPRLGTAAHRLLAGCGRPLWWQMSKDRPLKAAIDAIRSLIDPQPPREFKIWSDEDEFREGLCLIDFSYYALLAIRVQANVPSRSLIASLLIRSSYATLITLSRDHCLVSMLFRAEPLLAAAAASFMSDPKIAKRALSAFFTIFLRYGPETGSGGEVLIMLLAVATTDNLTKYLPFKSANCQSWLETMLGLEKGSLSSIETWLRNSLISISQFCPSDFSELNYAVIEKARFYGVGLYPQRRNNFGYDILLPIENVDGRCGAILGEIKTREKFDPDQKDRSGLSAKDKIARKCLEVGGLWPDGKPRNVAALILSIRTGKGYLMVDGENWHEFSMKFTSLNTWGDPDAFGIALKSICDQHEKYDLDEWKFLENEFELPPVADCVKQLAFITAEFDNNPVNPVTPRKRAAILGGTKNVKR